MKYYAEILHPTENIVIWHYFLEAPDEETAREVVWNQFITEQPGKQLTSDGGYVIITVEPDNDSVITEK